MTMGLQPQVINAITADLLTLLFSNLLTNTAVSYLQSHLLGAGL